VSRFDHERWKSGARMEFRGVKFGRSAGLTTAADGARMIAGLVLCVKYPLQPDPAELLLAGAFGNAKKVEFGLESTSGIIEGTPGFVRAGKGL